MPSDLRNIVTKELREIVRDPRLLIGMIIVPVLMLPLMGFGARVAFQATAEEMARMEIGYVNEDMADGNHTFSDILYTVMLQSRLTLRNSSAYEMQSVVVWAQNNNLQTVLVVPANFSETIYDGHTAEVRVYQILKHYSITEPVGSQVVSSCLETFNNVVVEWRIDGLFPGSSTGEILNPTTTMRGSVVRGNIVDIPPDAIIGTVFSSSYMVPLAIAMVIIFAAQLAATSVAMEKEQKTLEVLLTLPIRRTTILLGKLSGVIAVSALATIAMLISFGYYMSSFSIGGGQTIDLGETGLAPEPVGYALLAATLFLSIIAALALSVLLASYTKDVRSAQSLLGIIFLPVFMPAFLLMFAPLEILPVEFQVVIYAIPFSYPSLAGKALYTKEYLPVSLGVIYQVAFTAIVLAFASRLFASEKILTAKLRFKREKKVPKELDENLL